MAAESECPVVSPRIEVITSGASSPGCDSCDIECPLDENWWPFRNDKEWMRKLRIRIDKHLAELRVMAQLNEDRRRKAVQAKKEAASNESCSTLDSLKMIHLSGTPA